jgi:hypothetical protein
MRLIKSIVNINNDLVGFVVKAKTKEINPQAVTNEVQQCALSLQNIIQLKPRSSQFVIRDGRLICKPPFKINTLPMAVVDNNNNMQDINNEITLLSRILLDGKIKGFRVQLPNGNKTPFKYKDVLMLTNWYKPTNFTVRTKDGKNYIVGLRGNKIEDLPEEEMRSNQQTNKKSRTSSHSVDKKTVENTPVKRDADLVTLIDFVSQCEGCIVNLPNARYKSTTASTQRTSDDFTYINRGELGTSSLDYGEEKLNATIKFRKPGSVRLQGIPQDIYAFTWSAKAVFANGVNNMPVIGIGVTEQVADAIKSVYGEQLIAKSIENDKLYKMLSMRNDLHFFEISADKLDLMSEETAHRIADGDLNTKIIKNSYDLATCKIKISLAKEFKKEVEKAIGMDGVLNASKKQSKLFGLYNGLNNETLKKLKELGINPFTGEYTGKRELTEEELEKENEKTSVIKEENVIMLKFEAFGSTRPKVAEIEGVLNGTKKSKKVTSGVIDIYNTIKGLVASMDEQAYINIVQYLEQCNKELKGYKKTLWLCKVAWLTLGKGTLVTNGLWTEKESKSKKFRVFKYSNDDNMAMYVANINVQ